MIRERVVDISTGQFRVRELDTRTLLIIQEMEEGVELLNGLMLGELGSLLKVLAIMEQVTPEELMEKIPTANDLVKVDRVFRELNADFFETWSEKLLGLQKVLEGIQGALPILSPGSAAEDTGGSGSTVIPSSKKQ